MSQTTSARSHSGIDWNEERVNILRDLYMQTSPELSFVKIAMECSRRFGVRVTPNAVAGKTDRLQLPSRPSPIKRRPAGFVPPVSRPSPSEHTLDLLPCLASPMDNIPGPSAPSAQPSLPAPGRLLPCLGGNSGVRRRDGSGCLFPIGDPRDKSFRLCDADLAERGKPYCSEHKEVVYKAIS